MSFTAAPFLECFCGRTYSNSVDLEEHRRARGHFAAHVCGKYCNHPPVEQSNGPSSECGYCGKICERPDILEDHRRFTGHCYCSDCDISFESQSAFKIHLETEVHASEFKCCDCNIFFGDIHALNAHMASRAHRKPLPKKLLREINFTITGHVCNQCQRKFASSDSLQQHRESVKHKPLSSLRCPLAKKCHKKFKSPSALLHHLESGDCPSGMNRDEINRLVQSYDHDNAIHSSSALAPLKLSAPSASSLSSALSTRIPTPDSEFSEMVFDDESEWSLVTPAPSQDGLGGSFEGILLEGSEIVFEGPLSVDRVANLRCPLCPAKKRTFRTAAALENHMNSPAHSPKMYHCPKIAFLDSGESEKKGPKKTHFKTLSGLAQHLESGACRGGKKTFLSCISFIQEQLQKWGLGEMRLLLAQSKQ